MKKVFVATLLIGLTFFSFRPSKPSTPHYVLAKKWQTDSVFKIPESVIFDEGSKLLYVSNINGEFDKADGNGFISRLSLSGQIETLEWVKGLDAPKGMGIYKNKLYVADINKIVIIDIANSRIERKIPVAGSVFLNDITIDKNGNVYISDSSTKKIYILKNGVISVWHEGKTFKSPNGLLATDNGVKLIDMESGIFYNIGYLDKKLTKLQENLPSGDGIVEMAKDEYLISGWHGEVYYLFAENMQQVLDTKEQKLNAADIWYISSQKLLLVPTFFGNSIVAYNVN